ncbi:MAG TPA: hypothetical protein VLI21_10285, partial [Casimicrobiaceae bacterium]|nr:hypothetical protein [Casimicrobiaceae bacterium]
DEPAAIGEVYNVAVGERISLNELYRALRDLIGERHPELRIPAPHYAEFRSGDVRHSEADIGKARRLLGYLPEWNVMSGLARALPWYENHSIDRTSSLEAGHVRRVV